MTAPGEPAAATNDARLSCPARAGRWPLAAVAALGGSCVITQLALMRESLSAFSGNEMVLGIVLGLWLLLMGAGAWLGRASEKTRDPVVTLAATQIVVALVPLVQIFLLRALRNVVFTRGAAVGIDATVVAVFVLLLPYCLVAGYSLTLACWLLAGPGRPAGIGRGYVADSVGGVLGGVLFSFVLVRYFDHLAVLVFPALLCLSVAAGMAFRCGHRTLAISALGIGAAVAVAGLLGNLDGFSSSLQYQPHHVITRASSPYGQLVITESAGQLNFLENGIPLTSTRNDQHVEETVHYAMAQRPAAGAVLLVAGGISGTAREILKYPVRRVDYVELDPLVVELGRRYLPENLADPRIRVQNTDGRLFINRTSQKYDVVILDLPTPSTAQLNRFYTVEFMAAVKRVLMPDGVLSFALSGYENYVSTELARLLASAQSTLRQSFQNTLVLPAGRVFLLGSDGPLYADIAARLEAQQVRARLVNRHYLDAMLTPDRMADMARATAQPAAVNQDFNPRLYYYHLRHWMSQFSVGVGIFHAMALLLLGVYLVRLRRSALVLFASGFAASALELVLLLGFQILCGSVYHQVGVIVPVFMAGLALGAWVANRGLARANPVTVRKVLTLLAVGIAVYAITLPVLLPGLERLGPAGTGPWLVKSVIALLALVVALLVGMQFPLANHLEFNDTAAGVARCYTADFVGACLGALLASTVLIPLMGVAWVCWLTAGLNLLGGTAMQFQKAVK